MLNTWRVSTACEDIQNKDNVKKNKYKVGQLSHMINDMV